MPGLDSFLWGGPAALVVAAAAFAGVLLASRRGAAAWNVGVVAGFAAGSVALAAHSQGWAAAAERLLKPIEAHGRLPLVALAGAAPAFLAAITRRRWSAWLLAAPLAALAPLWLLWGGRYLPKQELRDAGFAEHAWSSAAATGIVAAIAAATLAAWWWWRRAEAASLPVVRSLLAALALGGAAATVACTGSITYAHGLAVLATAVAACGAMAWAMKANAGAESAAGSIVLATASLLVLAVGYSELQLWRGVALAIVVAVSAGWLPIWPQRPRRAAALRAALVVIPLAIIVGQAASQLAASQRPGASLDEADVYSMPSPG
jgi:hypothetical protein